MFWLTAALADFPCATLEILRAAPPVRHGVVAAAGPEKTTRDMYSATYEQQSDNFVVRWGPDGRFSEDQLTGLLNAMELAWRMEIEEMGHPAPYGSDVYKFNVYIGGTGGDVPGNHPGAAGYYRPDDDGWPMIVLTPDTVRDLLATEATSIHEMYHAIQDSTGRYEYSDLSTWYWEATAEWVSVQVLPDNPIAGQFAFGYLMLPKLPVNLHDPVGDGTLEEYHAYGAYLFPTYLTARFGTDVVRDSWLRPDGGDDPMETMRAILAERGEDLNELWLDHIAHNAVLDYPFGVRLERQIEYASETWPDAGLYRGTVTENGQSGSKEGNDAPGRYGALVFRMPEAHPGALRIQITGHEVGSRGSRAHFGARLITFGELDTPIYTPLSFERRHAEITLEDGLPSGGLYLVVGAWSEETEHWDKERFPFDWSFEIEAPEEEVRACGCASQGNPGLLFVLLPWWRRRLGGHIKAPAAS